jgi:hypothetical protein
LPFFAEILRLALFSLLPVVFNFSLREDSFLFFFLMKQVSVSTVAV